MFIISSHLFGELIKDRTFFLFKFSVRAVFKGKGLGLWVYRVYSLYNIKIMMCMKISHKMCFNSHQTYFI